jgi:hypothetical protein
MMHKRRTRARRTGWIVAIALTLTLIGGAGYVWFGIKSMPPSAADELDATDREVFDKLTEQYRAFADRPADLWTADYRYDTEPLILIRADSNRSSIWHYAYVINASVITDVSGMQKVDFPGNPLLDDVYATKTLGAASLEYWQPLTFTTTTLGDTPILAMKYAPGELDGGDDKTQEVSTFALHEAFHINAQQKWDFDRGPAGDRIFDFPTDDAQMSLLRTEFRILDALTGQTDPTIVASRARDLLAIRAARYERWPALRVQDNTEAIEGTAVYLQRRMSDLTGGPIGILTNKMGESSTFTDVLAWIEQDSSRRGLLERSLYYETGAQLGYVLDVVAPDWKIQIEPPPAGQRRTPHASLIAALGDPGTPTHTQIADIQARYP